MARMAEGDKINRGNSRSGRVFEMIVTLFLTLAVVLGGVVLLILYVGRKYEIRHNVGEMDEQMDEDEQQTK